MRAVDARQGCRVHERTDNSQVTTELKSAEIPARIVGYQSACSKKIIRSLGESVNKWGDARQSESHVKAYSLHLAGTGRVIFMSTIQHGVRGRYGLTEMSVVEMKGLTGVEGARW